MRNLNICVTLYHGYELLIRHGLRSFLNFFQEHSEKPLLRSNTQLFDIMADVEAYLGPKPNIDMLPDGSVAEISEHTKYGHPKFYKLRDILLSHFEEFKDDSSRVIVFCEYRESVIEAYSLLIQHKPILKPKIFLGQGAITQKQQINVVKAFRQGECNTLISTCIGEEGLDVGNVDLIVCFDVSNKSPVRMIQRMGRTGRKRQGRVIVLVTEGKEQQTLKECLIQKHYLSSNMLQSKELHSEMYKSNPRMVPENITPRCQKIFITVQNKSTVSKSANLKDMFSNMAAASCLSQEMKDVEIIEEFVDRIASPISHWNKENPLNVLPNEGFIDFSKKLEKLRNLQPIGKIGHSTNSEILVSLLQFAEWKRYNIPITQLPKISGQVIQSSNLKRTKFEKCDSLSNFKQSDIRTMFVKSKSFDIPSSNTIGIPEENFDIIKTQKTQEISKQYKSNDLINELHREISNYLLINISVISSCKICDDLFPCSQFKHVNSNEVKISDWIQPDLSVLDSINLKNLTEYLNPPSQEMDVNFDNSEYFQDPIDITDAELDRQFNNKCEPSSKDSNSFAFQAPQSIKKVLQKCNLSETLLQNDYFDNIEFTQFENAISTNKCDNLSSTIVTNPFTEKKKVNSLAFFKLKCIEDIFVNLEESDVIIDSSMSPTDNKKNIFDEEGSPILSSFEKVRLLKSKVQKRLFSQERNCNVNANKSRSKPNLSNLKKLSNTCFYKQKAKDVTSKQEQPPTVSSSAKSKNYVKQLASNIHDICDLSIFGLDVLDETVPAQHEGNNLLLENKMRVDATSIHDFCDLSIFGLDISKLDEFVSKSQASTTDSNISLRKNKMNIDNLTKSTSATLTANIEDFSDLSAFGLDVTKSQTAIGKSPKKTNDDATSLQKHKEMDNLNKCISSTSALNIDDFCNLSVFGLDVKKSQNAVSKSQQKPYDNATSLQKHKKIDNLKTSISPPAASNIDGFTDLSDKAVSKSQERTNDSVILLRKNKKSTDNLNKCASSGSRESKPVHISKKPSNGTVYSLRKRKMSPDKCTSSAVASSIHDFCDSSVFELNVSKSQKGVRKSQKKTNANATSLQKHKKIDNLKKCILSPSASNIDDFCDLSSFGLDINKLEKVGSKSQRKNNKKSTYNLNKLPEKTNNNKNKTNIDNTSSTLASTINDFCDLSVFGLDVNELNQHVVTAQNKTKESGKQLKLNEAVNTSQKKYDSSLPRNKLTADNLNKLTSSAVASKKFDITGSNDLFDYSTISEVNLTNKLPMTQLNVDDFCNLEAFGIDSNISTYENARIKTNTEIANKTYNIDDVCDLSAFGISTGAEISDICNLSTFSAKSQGNIVTTNNSLQSKNGATEFKTPNRKVNKLSISKTSASPNVSPKLNDTFHTISVPLNIKSTNQAQMTDDQVINSINSIVDKYWTSRSNVSSTDNNSCINFNSPIKKRNLERSESKTQLSITQMINFIDTPSLIKKDHVKDRNVSKNRKKGFRLLQKPMPEDETSFVDDNLNINQKRSTPCNSVSQKNVKSKLTPVKQTGSNSKYQNSDDEFDITPIKKLGSMRPKLQINSTARSTASTIETCRRKRNGDGTPIKKRKIKKKVVDCPFIDNEAVLSSDEYASVSEGKSGSSQDILETSFVDDDDDDNIELANSSDMHARYLQSVKSPLLNRGAFKIPLRFPSNANIFSQEVDNENNTYVNDSFCINTEDISLSQQSAELSQLEIAEMILKERRKKRKKMLIPEKETNTKRRRIICISSEDSD